MGDIVFSDQPAADRDTQTAVNLLVDGKVVRTATGAGVDLFAQGGTATLNHLQAWQLNSAWQ